MKRSEFETRLRTALHTTQAQSFPPELPARLRQELLKKRRFEPVGFSVFFKQQIRFIGWKIWLFQAMLLALLLGIFWNPVWDGIGAGTVAGLLCGFALVVSAVAVPVVCRSLHYGMHELEGTTYFSAGQVLLAKLLLVGVGDGAMLLVIAAAAASGRGLAMSEAVLYVAVPFLMGSCGLLWLMRHAEASRFLPYSLGLYGLLGAAILAARQNLPELFQQTLSAPWILIMAVLAVFGWHQMNQILRRTTYAELQLM